MAEIVIHEVGLRDGLQMEKELVPTEQKAHWLGALVESGVDIVQLGSFVHPLKVPQMADTDALFERFARGEGERAGKRPILSGLVLNERGLERGLACGVEMFCMGVSASDTHSRKNTGQNTAEATKRIIGIARRAEETGKKVQVSVQSAFGCGHEGPVPEDRVLGLVKRFLDSGLRTISLADTAGHAVPERVESLFGAVTKLASDVECACHFHNTYGLGLANCCAAMRAGVRYFESAVAGLGGCPFAVLAGGNVCTEDFVHYLQQTGRRRDIRLDRLIETARDMAEFFHREMPGSLYKIGPLPQPAGTAASA